MIDNTPQDDRILIAQIHGEANRRSEGGRPLTEAEHAAAVDALREIGGGRPDLLAHVCGILEAFAEGAPYEARDRQSAQLCRDAGADPEEIPRWIEIGRERRADAGRPPFSAARRRPPRPVT